MRTGSEPGIRGRVLWTLQRLLARGYQASAKTVVGPAPKAKVNDLESEQVRLAKIGDDIRDAERLIAEQLRHIAQLAREQQPTDAAEDVLDAMRSTVAGWRQERALISARITTWSTAPHEQSIQ